MMEWIKQALASGVTGNPSSKRLVMIIAALALVLVLLGIGGACAWRILRSGDLGTGAVGALLGVSTTAAALAGVAYRKPDTGGTH